MAGSGFFSKYLLKKAVFTQQSCNECFDHYDKNGDNVLDKHEFSTLLNDFFRNGTKSRPISEELETSIQDLLDEDKDGMIGRNDFKRCCYYWLKQLLEPVAAFILIDVQNDFIDGSLSLKNCPAGQDGAAIVSSINFLLDSVPFSLVVYSKDWHPPDHISFVENLALRPLHPTSKVPSNEAKVMDTVVFAGPPKMEQKLWPCHCVQNSWGSELHPDLKVVKSSVVVNKGTNSNVDSYSAFWDNKKLSQTELVRTLVKHKVTDVYLCGLAYDVCVAFTGLHSIEHGFRTVIVEDCCRGVDLQGIDEMKSALLHDGALIVHSSQVRGLVENNDRLPEMGYRTAVNVALARQWANNGMVHRSSNFNVN